MTDAVLLAGGIASANRPLPRPTGGQALPPDAAISPVSTRRSLNDIVNLSPEAVRAMDARSLTITVPPPGSTEGGRVPPEMELQLARGEYTLKQADYMRKATDLLRQTLGLADDQPMMLGGGATALIDRVAERNGLEKPEMPAALRQAGMKAPFEDEAKADGGVIGIGMPGNGASLQIAFDRNALAFLDKPQMVALKPGNDRAGPLTGTIKEGPMGRYIDMRADKGTNLWAVTDGGTGPNARVLASVRSAGMDDNANTSALTLLASIKRLFAGE
jgi:hypothetical protein